MHHVVINVTTVGLVLERHVASRILVRGLPAAGSGDWKVVNNARAILPRGQHVAHARLVGIDTTQLRYLAFVLLALIKLDMLRGRFDVLLKCFTLLRLGRLRLLNLTASGHESMVVFRRFVARHQVACGRHWQLSLAPQRAVHLPVPRLSVRGGSRAA